MSTVSDLAPAPATAEGAEPSRRRTPRAGAGTPIASRTLIRTGKSRHFAAAVRRTASIFVTTIFIMAVTAFLFLAIGPRVFGYQTSTMLTGSMSPLINPGDVVVTVRTPVSEIAVGDVITYHIPVEDHRVETHRITEILTNADGTTAVRTKGDANNGVDPWTATLQETAVDRHVFTVPYLGGSIRTLRQPVVLNTLMYGAPAVLVVGMLASIWRKDPESP